MNEDRSSHSGRSSHGAAKHDAPRWYERLLALGRHRGGSVRDELEDVLEHSAPTGEFSPTERALLRNVLALNEMRVEDAMVPRADIVAIREDASLADALALFRSAGHSRLPVYGESLDDPRGMVHIRDFLDYLASCTPHDGGEAPAFAAIDLSVSLKDANLLRPVLYVPPSMPAADLLARMQSSRTHMALVIDEYGGTDGLVSMEDVVELIVGDIEDEHDFHAGPMIAAGENGAVEANARASLEEISRALGVPLAESEFADEIDTLGGLVAHMAGRIPAAGEFIEGPFDLVFEVLEADPRRLKRIRIHRNAGAGHSAGVSGPDVADRP
ncbi:hemolysin family protein [Camelimonas abortus]|uniref:Hemolysin family protein n=1 Tax=Camelimonas abortus TaxID=1017184 RepID=A0ABV7LC79_9HYPH